MVRMLAVWGVVVTLVAGLSLVLGAQHLHLVDTLHDHHDRHDRHDRHDHHHHVPGHSFHHPTQDMESSLAEIVQHCMHPCQ